jgi:hypothetical protein
VSHETSTAVTSLLSAKVFIPLLQQKLQILADDIAKFREFVVPKASIVRQLHWFQPKLGLPSRLSHMYVR